LTRIRERLPWLAVFLGGVAAFPGYVAVMSLLAPTFYHWVSYSPQESVFLTTVTTNWVGDLLIMTLSSIPLFYVYVTKGLLPQHRLSVPSLLLLSLLLAWVLFALVLSPFSPVFLLASIVVALVLVARESRPVAAMDRVSVVRAWGWGFLAAWSAVGLGAGARWLLHAFLPTPMYGAPHWHLPVLELEVFHSLQPLAAPLLLVVLYLWIPVLFYSRVRIGELDRLVSNITGLLRRAQATLDLSLQREGRSVLSHAGIVLIGAFLLSALVGWFPYAIAPEGGPWDGFVGEESALYYSELTNLTSLGPADAFSATLAPGFSGTRPAYFQVLLLLNALGLASPGILMALQPALLAVALAFASYFFVWACFQSREHAALAAILVPLSPVMTGGMFGGLYANWLGLVVLLLLYGTFVLSLRGKAKRNFLALSVLLSALLLFIHPWTWDLMMVTMLIFLAYHGIGALIERNQLLAPPAKNAGILLLAGVVTATIGGIFTFSGDDAAVALFQSDGFGLQHLGEFWDSLFITSYLDFGGSYSNYIFLGAAALGLLMLFRRRDSPSVLLLAWVTAVGFGFPLMDFNLQGRLLLELPSVPLATLGLFKAASWAGGRSYRLTSLFLASFGIIGLNYALRAASNMLLPI
ncbi:MAG: hypothetical protein ACE5JL_14465, partial [Dehalococcoidia bacterium]